MASQGLQISLDGVERNEDGGKPPVRILGEADAVCVRQSVARSFLWRCAVMI
jgi:hypothetical protein